MHKMQLLGYKTGQNSDQKEVDVCRTRNQLKRKQFVINYKLYHHFITTSEKLFILTRTCAIYANDYYKTLVFSNGVICLRVAIAMKHVGTN